MIKRQFGTNAAGCKAIHVNGNAIIWSNQVKHLGNVIDCNAALLHDCFRHNVVVIMVQFYGNYMVKVSTVSV